MSEKNTNILTYLLKNQTVIYDSNIESYPETEYPSFVTPNMVRIGDDNRKEIIESMIEYRNKNSTLRSKVTSVESKIDIWINS